MTTIPQPNPELEAETRRFMDEANVPEEWARQFAAIKLGLSSGDVVATTPEGDRPFVDRSLADDDDRVVTPLGKAGADAVKLQALYQQYANVYSGKLITAAIQAWGQRDYAAAAHSFEKSRDDFQRQKNPYEWGILEAWRVMAVEMAGSNAPDTSAPTPPGLKATVKKAIDKLDEADFVIYLDEDFNPVSPEKATLVKVRKADGKVIFARPNSDGNAA